MRQDPSKYVEANQLIEQATLNGTFLISWLSIQEFGFVLAKLKQPNSAIRHSIRKLINSLPVNYGSSSFERAIELADQIGFKHFNDCLHTALAEQNCTELYTYNHDDFKKIKPLTSLTIYIL